MSFGARGRMFCFEYDVCRKDLRVDGLVPSWQIQSLKGVWVMRALI
jgi:hypothetical protein